MEMSDQFQSPATLNPKHNRSLKVVVQGLDFMAHPYTYIHTYFKPRKETPVFSGLKEG
jgi:hypothetical protein